ncbi:uncharacterized protein B0T23DRAFT_175505 [Neurospora hispaniola]|uniref:Uncharacterized protein n=1 Tax=Neurospora hispaniola TaxID=588809 RepID=A0AAJ0MQM8_9PEZI|nr:hypothetical protein B0T23DRAFT_175505 [Neurospora hispaniola]
MSCPCSRCYNNPSTPHHSEPSSPPPYSPSSPGTTSSGTTSTTNMKKSNGFPWFKKSTCSANPPRYSVESTASDLVGLLG